MRKPLADLSLWTLVGTNILVIAVALNQGWDLGYMLWVYWFQSLTIGIVTFIRILSLKNYSTEGYTVNGNTVEPTTGTKINGALFFMFHYGLFHFVYYIFLSNANPLNVGTSNSSTSILYVTAVLFLANHLFSFFYNKPDDRIQQNIGAVMLYPYARILPMHLVIIFGSELGSASILLFLLLKTASDAAMHLIEHHQFKTIAPQQ